MVRLFVVDDETEIRSNVIKKINWEDNGIQICGEASNGKETIELLEEASPDILIVDIRMPIMDGLELTEYLAKYKPHLKIIILSGYDDFSYAQRALKFGAFDYLLKPSRAQDILDAVIKTKTSIENERSHESLFLNTKQQLSEAIPLAKEKILTKLIYNQLLDLDYINENFNKLGITLNSNRLIAFIIHINDFMLIKSVTEDSIALMKYKIKNMISETLSPSCNHEILEDLDDYIIILNEPDNNCLLPLIHLLKEKIYTYLLSDITIGIGRIKEDITSLYLSINEAKEALKASFYLGSNIIICFDEIENIYKSNMSYPVETEKKILDCLKPANNIEDLEIQFREFFNSLHIGSIPKDYIIKACISLLLSVYKYCIEKNIDTDIILGAGLSYLDEIYSIHNIDELKDKIWGILISVRKNTTANKSTNRLVLMATKYIKDNYMNDINLEILASNLYVTPSYLSMLFKNTLDMNFVDYLNKIRIEKACELLQDIRYKTYEISDLVGYNDVKYFSYIFKKVTGLTTSQYKNNKD